MSSSSSIFFKPSYSFLHNVNPRFKVMAFIITSVSIFFAPGVTGLGLLILFAILVNLLGRTPYKALKGILKTIVPIFVITVVMNILILKAPTNPVPNDVPWVLLFHIWKLPVYLFQIMLSVEILMRIIIIILFATSLIQSTEERAMTEGITWLLSPLKVFKFPVSEIGIMITLAIRFIPTLIYESKLIMRSQAARGISWYSSGVKEKVKAVGNLFLPLFVTNFSRADDISNAMIARGYVVKAKRTNYFNQPVTWRGWVYASILALMLTLIFVLIFTPFPMFLDYGWYMGYSI